MRDPRKPAPVVPLDFIPAFDKPQETVLGPLMVWFGPKALDFIETRFSGHGESYAQDELDRFLLGGKLGPDVKALDLDNEPPIRSPKEAQPLAELVHPEMGSVGTAGQDNVIFFVQNPDGTVTVDAECATVGCGNRKSEGRFVGDRCAPCHDVDCSPTKSPEFEPIGTLPVVGDTVVNLVSKHEGVITKIADYIYWGDCFSSNLDICERPGTTFRILKRTEAEAWEGTKNSRRMLIANEQVFSKGPTCRVNLNPNVWSNLNESAAQNREALESPEFFGFVKQTPETAAQWLAEVKKAGLL